GLYQIIERLWSLLLVERVLGDQLAHIVKVLSEHRLTRAADCTLVLRNCNRNKDQQNADHDHQFNQGKSRKRAKYRIAARAHPCTKVRLTRGQPKILRNGLAESHYQSLYLEPSRAVPCDFV